jgi:hypothetical protein
MRSITFFSNIDAVPEGMRESGPFFEALVSLFSIEQFVRRRGV